MLTAVRGNSKSVMPFHPSSMKMITMPKCSVTNDSLIIEFLASVNESLKLWFVSKLSKVRIIRQIGSTGTSLLFGSSKQSCAFWYIVLYQFYYIIYWGYFLRRKYYISLPAQAGTLTKCVWWIGKSIFVERRNRN